MDLQLSGPENLCLSVTSQFAASRENKANIDYNAGVVAGQKASQGINFTGWRYMSKCTARGYDNAVIMLCGCFIAL